MTHAFGSYFCKLPRIDGQFVSVVAIGALLASAPAFLATVPSDVCMLLLSTYGIIASVVRCIVERCHVSLVVRGIVQYARFVHARCAVTKLGVKAALTLRSSSQRLLNQSVRKCDLSCHYFRL